MSESSDLRALALARVTSRFVGRHVLVTVTDRLTGWVLHEVLASLPPATRKDAELAEAALVANLGRIVRQQIR